MNTHFSSLSRSTCAESAKTIATIFEVYRSRFDLTQVYGTAVQHAGTSATALMGEIFLEPDAQRRMELLEMLSSLRLSMSLMARNYQPAGHMLSVLDQFIRSAQGRMNVDVGEGKSRISRNKESQKTVPRPHGEPGSAVAAANEASLDASLLPPPIPLEMDHSNNSNTPSIWTASSRKRPRMDGSYTFTPTGAQSPSGLPFLPSSFLEGLGVEDSLFGDLAGMNDFNFQWDCPSGSF